MLIDLKLAHYMKIPPKSMIATIAIGSLVGSFVSLSTTWYMMTSSFSTIIGKKGKGWEANAYTTFNNSGAIFGAIGPSEFFGSESYKFLMPLGFGLGFFMPFVPWLLNKRSPSRYWQMINIPIILFSCHIGRYQNHIIMPLLSSFVFQFLVPRMQRDWYKKYNYVLSAAIGAGVGSSTFISSILQGGFKISAPENVINPASGLDYYCFEEEGWFK